jgi:hypothetical protein
MPTDTSWWAGAAKVPSSLGPACVVLESEERTRHLFESPSRGPWRSRKNWFRTNHHWWWVVVLSILSTWLCFRTIMRWASWKSESENWHRKVPNFRILIRQRYPYPAWRSKMEHVEYSILLWSSCAKFSWGNHISWSSEDVERIHGPFWQRKSSQFEAIPRMFWRKSGQKAAASGLQSRPCSEWLLPLRVS